MRDAGVALGVRDAGVVGYKPSLLTCNIAMIPTPIMHAISRPINIPNINMSKPPIFSH